MNVRMRVLAVVLATIGAAGAVAAPPDDLEKRIDQHRKGWLRVRVKTADGKPAAGAQLTLHQVSSDFKFGCNIFMLGECGEENWAYRDRFNGLFDFATLPFYWWTYEPEEGRPQQERLEKLAAWCHERGVTPKGHPLFWNFMEQDWLPADPDKLHELALQRVERDAKAFAKSIGVWDVVNEASQFERCAERAPKLTGMWKKVGREVLIREAFERARRANPKATLLINDYDTSERYEQLIESLRREDGTFPFDAIGIQSHMHNGAWSTEKIRDVCERFGRFGLPLHFTELTILSGEPGWNKDPWPSTPEGEKVQAEAVERVYTELFAQPMVEAITWWDFSDRGAWMNAPAGLLDKDMRPKPAYDVLKRLITKKWRAPIRAMVADSRGEYELRVFRGEYEVTAVDAALKFKSESVRVKVSGDDRKRTKVITLKSRSAD